MNCVHTLSAALVLLFLAPATVLAQTVTLAWNRNPEPNVTSYLVSYGTLPRGIQAYPTTVAVGNLTSYSFTRPPAEAQTPYYFSVQARNSAGLTSSYSNEVVLLPVGGNPVLPADGDFNGDGRIDLLWQHQTHGYISAWFMNGVAFAGATSLGQASDTRWRIVGSGDFNRDGQADILWQHRSTGELYVWYMNGTTLVGGGFFTTGPVSDLNWEIRAVADMNRDGSPDVIWQHRVHGTAVTWMMNGLTLVSWRDLTSGPLGDVNWKIAGVGDFDDDGYRDVLWRHNVTGSMIAWLMNDTTLSATREIHVGDRVPDAAWQIRAVVDLNGDRRPDFVWQNTVDGWIHFWLMDGTTRMQTIAFDQSGDVGWVIVAPR